MIHAQIHCNFMFDGPAFEANIKGLLDKNEGPVSRFAAVA